MTQNKHTQKWITFIGQNIFEIINPYWRYCEETNKLPDEIIIFHSHESKEQFTNVAKALNIINTIFRNKKPISITPVTFDDENVSQFNEKTKNLFRTAEKGKWKLIIDISPTTWSFVPVYIMRAAERNKDIVSAVYYMQYSKNLFRKKPYAQIPVGETIINNLLNPD